MAYINYQNLPSTSTPLNATNLNSMQVEESGSNTNGNYIKYNDGTLICYHNKQFSGVNITTANGSLYTATLVYPFDFPIAFIEEPVVNVTVQDIPDFSYCFPYIVRRNIEQIISIVLLRPSAVSNATTKVGYIAIGRWK